MSKIEVLRVPDDCVFADEGDLLLCGRGVPVVIDKRYKPTLLAALLEDAGAAKIHAISSSDGMIFRTTACTSSAWLIPIPEGAEG